MTLLLQSETIDLTQLRQKGDGVSNIFSKPGASSRFKEQADKDAKFIDSDGLPYIGQVITLCPAALNCHARNL